MECNGWVVSDVWTGGVSEVESACVGGDVEDTTGDARD